MSEKELTTTTNDVAREFTYEEKPRITPTWQLVIDIGETIVLTVVMFFIIRLAVQDFQVEGTSMIPTLQNNQFVLVDKLTYDFSSPQRGDVIVFIYPLDHSKNYIKRIIGLPGDRVEVAQDGQVSVNGTNITEPYVNDLDNSLYGVRNIVLQPHQYYVLGDNRGGSSDSREWGPVPQNDIIGKAALVYWPFSSLHFLPNEHPVFNNVPASGVATPLTPARARLDVVTTSDLFNNGQPLLSLFLLGMPPVTGIALQARRKRQAGG